MVNETQLKQLKMRFVADLNRAEEGQLVVYKKPWDVPEEMVEEWFKDWADLNPKKIELDLKEE